jgi:hypothetical protein
MDGESKRLKECHFKIYGAIKIVSRMSKTVFCPSLLSPDPVSVGVRKENLGDSHDITKCLRIW